MSASLIQFCYNNHRNSAAHFITVMKTVISRSKVLLLSSINVKSFSFFVFKDRVRESVYTRCLAVIEHENYATLITMFRPEKLSLLHVSVK